MIHILRNYPADSIQDGKSSKHTNMSWSVMKNDQKY